jgi:hypothetical protein
MAEVIHAAPLAGKSTTHCCGKTLFELPMADRVTVNDATVNCPKAAPRPVVPDTSGRAGLWEGGTL